jgi:hypothetical protein
VTDAQARRVVRADLATRAFVVFVATSLVTTLAFLLTLTVQSAHRGKDNRDTLTRIKAQSTLIKSCTTPGESCYERGQRQTGDAVASINRVIIASASCAVGQTGTPAQIEDAIRACVVIRLGAAR